ncbi:hypothetical protein I79_017599 [Cricetulus griseus]|uniref:Uncharacterized protein n=1 Tax=Cricetulus griseus TaxID=10029 RepID=G3I2F7_CRIGR|nr:hypothetical protein I79_017599 [Cricetulus griseus]
MWSKNIQVKIQIKSDVKDQSSNIIANDATFAYDLSDIQLHPHLSFLTCKLLGATSFAL